MNFAEDDTIIKIALIAGPAGPFTFCISNSSFAGGGLGCGAICAAQHCGLGGAGEKRSEKDLKGSKSH